MLKTGDSSSRAHRYAFMVPVGIKYIEEQRRTDREYNMPKELAPTWRDTILLGGEESSGLTTKGHVTDKDGIWANLLVIDMLAFYGSRGADSIDGIWRATCQFEGCWPSYGGREDEGSNSGRIDADAILEAKEAIVDHFLDRSDDDAALSGLEVVYRGGVRYDLAELQLRRGDDTRHFLRVRMSGTEPINRFYVESSDRGIARSLLQAATSRLEECIADQIDRAGSEWRLADILAYTKFSQRVLSATTQKLRVRSDWSAASLASKLRALADAKGQLESRNRRMASEWSAALARQ
jgi:phosphomannomutase